RDSRLHRDDGGLDARPPSHLRLSHAFVVLSDAAACRPLRIAVLSPVWFPVPPNGYGGIEWIVSLLADGLVEAGHEVTLFASGDSTTKARLAAVFPIAPSEWI